jgi:hypothetical protein
MGEELEKEIILFVRDTLLMDRPFPYLAIVVDCKQIHVRARTIFIDGTAHLTSGDETTSDTHDPYQSVKHVRKCTK